MDLHSFARAVANTALRGVDNRLPEGWVAIFPERRENLCGISRKVPLIFAGRRSSTMNLGRPVHLNQ